MGSRGEELQFATKLGREMGAVMVEQFHAPTLEVRRKPDGTLVIPKVDLAISDAVVKAYSARGQRVTTEERGGTAKYGDRNAKVLDPNDGTADFVNGRRRRPKRSLAMFSLADVVDGEAVVGVANAPLLLTPRMYAAAKGMGAFCITGNKKRRLKEIDKTLNEGIVLVSENSHHPYIDRLARQGFTTIPLAGAVFKACCVADPELLAAYDPKLAPKGKRVIGFVSTTAWAHDYMAANVIGGEVGVMRTGIDGGQLKLGYGKNGCIFANNERTHERIMRSLKV